MARLSHTVCPLKHSQLFPEGIELQGILSNLPLALPDRKAEQVVEKKLTEYVVRLGFRVPIETFNAIFMNHGILQAKIFQRINAQVISFGN